MSHTPASGAYSFTGLAPGGYKVCFTSAGPATASAPPVGAQVATDNDAASARRLLANLHPDHRRSNTTLDAGLLRRRLVGDFVWMDSNAQRHPGQRRAAAWPASRVTLYHDGTGNAVGSPFVTTGQRRLQLHQPAPGS